MQSTLITSSLINFDSNTEGILFDETNVNCELFIYVSMTSI